jgi:AraC family transcriptional regulator
MENVRIYEIPSCKMVSSQCGMFGDGKLEAFEQWLSELPVSIFPKDFLWYDKEYEGFVWYYIYEEGMSVPEAFKLVDFTGGLYAVATDVDGEDNRHVIGIIKDFIKDRNCFEEDLSRYYLGNVITPTSVSKIMGYSQMDYYVPIKLKSQTEAKS